MNKKKLAKILAYLDFHAYQYSNNPDELRDVIAAIVHECDLSKEFSEALFNDVRYAPDIKRNAKRGYERIMRRMHEYEEIYI